MKNALNHVDLAFVVDTTGSMGPFINLAREQMIATLKVLTADASSFVKLRTGSFGGGQGEITIDLQVGIVEYRDHPPQDRTFVFRVHQFNSNLKRVQKTINKLKPDGGGDEPEAVYDGLRAACNELTWRSYSRRIAVLVGDAPPHGYHRGRGDGFPDGCPCGLTPDSTTAMLEEHGIVLYALGLTPRVRESFSHLAHFSGGEFFDAGQGANAIETLKQILTDEFSDLEFDWQVLDFCVKNSDWSMDAICEALESPRGKVSTSLSRLGRRRLIG